MYDVIELYDDLVAVRRTQAVLPESASQETRSDLRVVVRHIEGKLTLALSLLTAEEMEEVIESLDGLHEGEARRDLENYL